MKTLTQSGLTILICLSIFSVQAQSLGSFTGIKCSNQINIIISQSEENTINIDASENVKEKIKTKIDDEVLEIFVDGKIKTDNPVSVTIGIKSLRSLDISGTAEVSSANKLNCEKLSIESAGAGNINLDLKAVDINTKISGAGNVKLTGSTQYLDAVISGAGELKAYNLETGNAKINVTGAGIAKINVVQSLDAEVSGAGSVIYKGNPTDRNVNISGAGSVRQTGEIYEKVENEDDNTANFSLEDLEDISIEQDTLNRHDPDTTKINFKKIKVWIIGNENDYDNDENGFEKSDGKSEKTDKTSKKKHKDNERNKHWAGLYLGVNGFSTPDYSLNLPAKANFMDLNYAKSIDFAFNFLEKDIHIYRDYAMLVTGLGVDFNTYSLKNNVTLQSSNNKVWGVTDSINKFTKNKLKTTFVNVPVLIAFNTNNNPDKAFHFAAGMIFGYDVLTKTKQVYNLGGDEIKSKIKNDYNINPFRYSATAQIGYGNLNLYASYALNTLFKGGKGPSLYPFTVGIRIMGF